MDEKDALEALAQSDAEPVAIHGAREQALSEAYVKGFEDGRAQSNAEPVAATSRSLLRPANQKPTICYCESGKCSAPKPEWCVGRRYADGFRDVAQSETVELLTKENVRLRKIIEDYDNPSVKSAGLL